MSSNGDPAEIRGILEKEILSKDDVEYACVSLRDQIPVPLTACCQDIHIFRKLLIPV